MEKRELPEAESGVIEREARASSERQEKENHQRRRRIKEANWSDRRCGLGARASVSWKREKR